MEKVTTLSLDQVRETKEENVFLVEIDPTKELERQIHILAYGEKLENGDGIEEPCGLYINPNAKSLVDAVVKEVENGVTLYGGLLENNQTIGEYMADEWNKSDNFYYTAMECSSESAMEWIKTYISTYSFFTNTLQGTHKPMVCCIVCPEGKPKKELKTYRLPVVWQSWGRIEVEAYSAEEAIKYAKEHVKDLPLPTESEYVEDTYFIDDGADGDASVEDTKEFLISCYGENEWA